MFCFLFFTSSSGSKNVAMRFAKEDEPRKTKPAIDLVSAVEEFHKLSSRDLSKLISQADDGIIRHPNLTPLLGFCTVGSAQACSGQPTISDATFLRHQVKIRSAVPIPSKRLLSFFNFSHNKRSQVATESSPRSSVGYTGTGENVPPNSWLVYDVEMCGIH
ncbi:hypothetical protein LXL04_031177 [Taraxacum kok-saghyz]